MKRPAKTIFISFIGVLAIGMFLWMRSLASWRPFKLGQVGASYGVSFLSSDDRTVLLASDDLQQSTILDLSTGRETDWPESPLRSAVFSQKSPEWGFVFENKKGMGELRARELQSGQLKHTFHWSRTPKKTDPEVLLSHDETTLSVVDSPNVFQWNVKSGKLMRRVQLEKPFLNPPLPDASIRFTLTPDGSRLIGCQDGEGKTWQLASGRVLRAWTRLAYQSPAFFSPDTRVVAYTYPSTTSTSPYVFVDTATGQTLWSADDDTTKLGERISESAFYNGEIFVPQNTNCEILDALTGRVKRKLNYPRHSNGLILRVTSDYIYTLNPNNEIQRWRIR